MDRRPGPPGGDSPVRSECRPTRPLEPDLRTARNDKTPPRRPRQTGSDAESSDPADPFPPEKTNTCTAADGKPPLPRLHNPFRTKPMDTPRKGKLYLIPCFIADVPYADVLPEKIRSTTDDIRFFAVENIRSARRFIRRILPEKSIDDLQFFEIGKRSDPAAVRQALAPCLQGADVGVISEAGVPAVADPGARVVQAAHRMGIQVVPLSGPSSLLMALMASGLSGQNFAFHGYLPIDPAERAARIRQIEQRSGKESAAQLFIETPFRNLRMFQTLLSVCDPATRLCIAGGISGPDEYIATRTIARWRETPVPPIDRCPTVFILQKPSRYDD